MGETFVSPPDRIILSRSNDGTTWRWTRRDGGNNTITGASTQGYNSEASARKNIEDTQAEPYVVIVR